MFAHEEGGADYIRWKMVFNHRTSCIWFTKLVTVTCSLSNYLTRGGGAYGNCVNTLVQLSEKTAHKTQNTHSKVGLDH